MNQRLLWGVLFLLLWAMPTMAQDANAGYQEALRRIEAARVSGATQLDLFDAGLSAVPPEIGQLTQLTKLHLGRNRLTTLPSEIEKLSQLKYLVLFENNFKTLPPEIIQLHNLEGLYLDGNQLTNLPPEIGQLTNLQVLSLHINPLITIPFELGYLPRLQSLQIFATNLPDPSMETGSFQGLPIEVQRQRTAQVLAYLRDYEAMQIRQTIVGIAAGVGAIAGVLLAFRWRQRRGLSEKKKRA